MEYKGIFFDLSIFEEIYRMLLTSNNDIEAGNPRTEKLPPIVVIGNIARFATKY